MDKQQEPIGFTVEGIIAMAGGSGKVAQARGLVMQSVAQWGERNCIPKKHAREVAIMAGLPLELVRPDMVRNGHAQAAAYMKQKAEQQ